MGQTSSGALWTETPDSFSTSAASLGAIVETSPGVFEILASGTPGAGLVSDGVGGYEITPGSTGTGRVVFAGATNAIIY